MAISYPKSSFASGEISPSLFGHVDLAKVETAASTMRNGFVNYRGGYNSRAGTQFLNFSKQRRSLGAAPPRLINWQFNNLQGYALEFGDEYVRFYFNSASQDQLPQPGIVTETPIAVSAVSQTNPTQVLFAGTFTDGDWVVFAGIGGMTILNSNTYIVAGAGAGVFTLLSVVDGSPVDSSGYPAYTSGGTVARIYTIASPYAAVDLDWLKFDQSADVMKLTLVNQATGMEYPPYELRRLGPLDWTLIPTAFGTNQPTPAAITVTATTQPNPSFSPPTLPAAYAYEVTSVNFVTGEESLPSPIGNVTNGVDMAETAGSNIINWSAVVGNVYYQIYRAPTSYNTAPPSTTVALPVPIGANFYLVGAAYGTQFVDTNITQDFNQTPPQGQDPFARGQILSVTVTSSSADWTSATPVITTGTGSGFVGEVVISGMEIVAVIVLDPGENYLAPPDTISFTGTGSSATAVLNVGPQSGTYPGLISFFQQRCIYANTENAPDTFFASQPGLFTNFDVSIPVTEADAITSTVTAQTVDGIQWMLSMPLGLLTFTGAGVWQIGAPGSFASSPAAITPTNEIAVPQSSIGCSSLVPPLKINWDVLYPEQANNNVLDLTYQIYFNIFAGTDITWPSTHLLVPHQIRQWCYSRSPDRIVWTVLDNGQLLSLTYVKEQEVAGWARHDTLGLFWSCCSVIEPPANALYVVVERPMPDGSTAFMIERMNNREWQTIEDCWCVDAGVQTELITLDAILYASSTSGPVSFLASAPVFGAGNAGQIIRFGGGLAQVTTFTDSEHVSGTWLQPCVETYANDPLNRPLPQLPGNWTIAGLVSEVAGLQHLAGDNVVGLADGVPIGLDPALQATFPALPPQSFGFLVPNSLGQLTLPFPASLVTLGLGFTPQLQSVYLNAGQPSPQGRRKMIYAATVRVTASGTFEVGANQTDASTVPPATFVKWTSGMSPPQLQFLDPPPPPTYQLPGGQTVQPLFSSDVRVPIPAVPRKPGQVAVQQLLPLPLNVTLFAPEVIPGDTEETVLPPRQQQGNSRNG